jgi:hypothetical protein
VGNWTKLTELNRTFLKEEVQMAKERKKQTKKHMRKCWPFLAIKEMQIKTILRFYLTPVRIPVKNTTNKKCWWRCWEQGNLIRYWWEYITTTLENNMQAS